MLKDKIFFVHTAKPTLVFLKSNVDDEKLNTLFKRYGIQEVTIPFGTTFKEGFHGPSKTRIFNEGESSTDNLTGWSKGAELNLIFTYKAHKHELN